MSEDRRPDASAVDRAIDAAWRHASNEEPAARADAAILGAARAAARDTATSGRAPRPGRGRWTHWRPMAAAAAVAALALLLVPRTQREEQLRTAPAQSPVAESEPLTSEAERDVELPPPQETVSAEAPAPPAADPAAGMQPVAPQASGASAAAEKLPAAARAEASAPGPVAAPSREATAAAADASADGASPQQWVDRIASLYAAGDMAGAATALQGFRSAYPDADAHLPPELRAWAAAVPRQP